MPSPKLTELRRRLHEQASAKDAAQLQRYFKTGPGEYGAGDCFIGVRVPALRRIARGARGLSLPSAVQLLQSAIHEERLLALMILVDAYGRADEIQQEKIYQLYLQNSAFVNNWDLVDSSAPYIVGPFLMARPRAVLYELAHSPNIWERRIAVLAAFHFIRGGEFTDSLRLAGILLSDDHDLIHKAVGWMLREIGKRNGATLRRFLTQHHHRMPRTMLRYAIEKFPERERQFWLVSS
jgi:3-methyladenine DNA glycosylase AlkD